MKFKKNYIFFLNIINSDDQIQIKNTLKYYFENLKVYKEKKNKKKKKMLSSPN